ncbi:hypothetical protein Dvina_02705 [Dactylosporangium vinaceum]|uniref:Uncharacterized protein n=1 Tax=Dactylosporangium vinaceum TaxID=53362 RepID=A0ABV5MEP8_9ACTN|nr:hypothetical protein [Dactylosporangium vinaceum]UAB97136.1 hypothetical protein Dvina_02705 [Dactylosporangium vinaceum]
MRISALSGACVLAVGLAALAAGLYYDQAHVYEWTHFAQSSNLTKGPVEAQTAKIFTLVGAIASAFGAAVAAGGALLARLGGRAGLWVLRLVTVLLLVLMLLVTVVVVVGSFTGDAPVAVVETPGWLLAAEWGALLLAVAGAGASVADLWRFVPAQEE